MGTLYGFLPCLDPTVNLRSTFAGYSLLELDDHPPLTRAVPLGIVGAPSRSRACNVEEIQRIYTIELRLNRADDTVGVRSVGVPIPEIVLERDA
jgi:hypothetical protein